MNPIVRYMILCDDVRQEPDDPNCWQIDCLMSNIVSLESLGVIFRLDGCRFDQEGMYSVQFWYNGARLSETPLRLRSR